MLQFTCTNSLAVEYLQELVSQMGLKMEILSGDPDLLVEDSRVVEVSGDPQVVAGFSQAYISWVSFKHSERLQQVAKLKRAWSLF